MDTKIISQAAKATLAGSLPFPEIVGMLINAGVEYYHVDYAGLCKSFYSSEGERVVSSITYADLPLIAPQLDGAALRAAIIDSQNNGQKYYDFTVRAMKAGVQAYYAFLRGQRVTYFGRNGDAYTEWFPGAEPKTQTR